MSRCHRLLIAAALVCCSSLPGLASAATQCINQSAPNPLEICVQDTGTPAVWVQQPNGRMSQYYGEYAWGSTIWLNGTDTGQAFSTGYFFTNTFMTPVSNATTGSGTAQDPYVITTIVDLGTSGVRLTQRFTYVNGDRSLRKTWTVENTSADTTFGDVRFFHGGDTFFGGEDSARSWWDAANNMVYVTNSGFTNSGFMGFFANPATPAAAYYGGAYWLTHEYATSTAQLPNTADSEYVDAGYMLQWNRDSLAPGQAWTFEGFETWSPPGALQVIAPADAYVFPDTTVERLFKVHNLTAAPLEVNLTATSIPADWTVFLPNGGTINVDGLTVAEVPVSVQVPADATAGATRLVEVSASSSSYTNASSSRLTVLQADYTISPASLSFDNVAVGNSETLSVTVTNGATASPLELGQVGAGNGLDAPFAITSDTCSNTTVDAGGACFVEITYTRTAISASADSFVLPILAPIITAQTIAVSSDELPSEHTVTANAGAGGTISPASALVTDGNTTSFTVTPSIGYGIANVTGCGGSLSGNTYTTGAITGACAVSATFSINSYTVSATAGQGGALSPSSASVNHGSTTSFTVTPSIGYSIANVTGCSGSLSGSSYTTGAITGACTVTALFAINVYTVTATAGAGGAITPATSNVSHGNTTAFALTPAAGYSIEGVSGCGGSLSGNTYTTAAVTGACPVSATFFMTKPSFEPAAPAAYDLDSTELMTPLPEGMAPRAYDTNGQELEVVLVDGQTRYGPGSHTLTWRAVDSRGVVGTVTQTLRVWPTVSMGRDTSVGLVQGNSGSFRIALNGLAPSYPYTIAYEVNGYLQGHDLESGSVQLAEGETEKDVYFAILETPAAGTPSQHVTVQLSGVENPGERDTLDVELRTVNSPSTVEVVATQEGERRSLFGRELGAITLTVEVSDPDSADTHTIEWRSPSGAVVTASGNELAIDPSSLPAGIHRFTVIVTDDATPPVSTQLEFALVLLDAPAALPDGVTGVAPNGIPADPQYSPALLNVLPEREAELTSYLIEGDPGVQLGLGTHALSQGLYQSELLNLQAISLPSDSVANVGGYFDFAISEMPGGDSASAVIPQRAAISETAAYRWFDSTTQQWNGFVPGPGDSIASAPGVAGHCPPPTSTAYQPGLNAGSLCVRLTISDGGPNDADGQANGVVASLGGVGSLSTVAVTTRGEGNGGGGSTDVWFLLMALLPLLYGLSRTGARAYSVKLCAAPFFMTALAILGGVSMSAAAAELDEGGLRVGTQIAVAHGDLSESDVNSRLVAAGVDATASFDDRSRTAWQINLEHDLTQYVGFSLGYTDLGEVGMSITGDVVDIEETLAVAARIHPHSADGYELGVTGRYPLFNRLFVTGRAGALRWESRYDAWNIDGQFAGRKDSGTDAFFGVGLEVPFLGRWRAVANFSQYRIDRETIEFAGVGVSCRID